MPRKDRNNVQSSSKNKLKIAAAIVLIGATVVSIANQNGVFEHLLKSKPASIEGASMSELADTPVPPSDKDSALPHQAAASSQRENAVPLLDTRSFDELSALFVLMRRVRASERDAATLMGMQRISLQAKREKLKEMRVAAELAKVNYEFTKADVDAKNYGKQGVGQITDGNDLPSLNHDSGFNGMGLGDDLVSGPDVGQALGLQYPNTADNRIITPEDVRLQALYNGYAHLAIKSKNFGKVKEGQTVLSRYKVDSIDFDLECITLVDTKDEITFTSCRN